MSWRTSIFPNFLIGWKPWEKAIVETNKQENIAANANIKVEKVISDTEKATLEAKDVKIAAVKDKYSAKAAKDPEKAKQAMAILKKHNYAAKKAKLQEEKILN